MVLSRISVNFALFCTQWFTMTIGTVLSFHTTTIKSRTQKISLTIKHAGFFIAVYQIKISVQNRFISKVQTPPRLPFLP